MKRIIKDEVPLFWSRYVKRHPNESYDRLDETDEGRNVRNEIRKHMLINQKYICCYCCKSVDEYNSHNEHIKPRAKFPKLSMNYNNLLASCKGKTCGEKKDRLYDEILFVSPLSEDCETHFRYLQNGEIKGLTDAGRFTIELLNLNEENLRKSRETLFKQCLEMGKYLGKKYVEEEYINEKNGKLPRFCDMVRFFMNEGLFDICID